MLSAPSVSKDESNNIIRLPFDIQIQYHILKMMMEDEAFLSSCYAHLKEEYFENATLGWIFKTQINHYEKFKKCIDILTLDYEILKFPQENRYIYQSVLERVKNSNYTDIEYLRQEMTGWVRSRKFIRLHKEMEVLYRANQRESAYEVTSNAINELKTINFLEDDYFNFNDIENLIDEAAKDNARKIPLGVPQFDEALLGGIPRQSLTTILGTTNSGKSVVLTNIAYHAIMNQKKVLYLYHEGRDSQAILRFISRFTGIPYYRFNSGIASFTPQERERLEIAKVVLGEYLHLKSWPKFGLTIEEVAAYVKTKKADFDFDIMIDDYAQLLYNKVQQKENRHNQAAVYRGLSVLASELGVAVVTAAQGNRAAMKDTQREEDRLLGLTDISECWDIAMASETVITITRSQDDENNDRLKLFLAKQRDGKKNIGVECKTDFTKMIAYDTKLGIKSLRLSDSTRIADDDEVTGNDIKSQLS